MKTALKNTTRNDEGRLVITFLAADAITPVVIVGATDRQEVRSAAEVSLRALKREAALRRDASL